MRRAVLSASAKLLVHLVVFGEMRSDDGPSDSKYVHILVHEKITKF